MLEDNKNIMINCYEKHLFDNKSPFGTIQDRKRSTVLVFVQWRIQMGGHGVRTPPLEPMMSSADNLCLTVWIQTIWLSEKCSWKSFLKRLVFKKMSADNIKNNYPACKELFMTQKSEKIGSNISTNLQSTIQNFHRQ